MPYDCRASKLRTAPFVFFSNIANCNNTTGCLQAKCLGFADSIVSELWNCGNLNSGLQVREQRLSKKRDFPTLLSARLWKPVPSVVLCFGWRPLCLLIWGLLFSTSIFGVQTIIQIHTSCIIRCNPGTVQILLWVVLSTLAAPAPNFRSQQQEAFTGRCPEPTAQQQSFTRVTRRSGLSLTVGCSSHLQEWMMTWQMHSESPVLCGSRSFCARISFYQAI